MGRLFGTDGIRGIANDGLDTRLAFLVGQAAALVLTRATKHKPVIYIGKDTRISSDMLEAALAVGVTSAGADAVLTGVAPTPAVAYLTKERADAGIVISASHNSFEYNGIKIFNCEGFKLSDELENEIEALLSSDMPLKTGAEIGYIRRDELSVMQYIEYLRTCAAPDLSGLRVAVDCANGAASETAEALFQKLNPAKLTVLHNEPDGININDNCGSTHMESLQKTVVGGGYDIGIAFDGDADRCLFVDHLGNIVDGDRIMAVCALHERDCGHLPGDSFVATVMSNLGLHVWARENGLRIIGAPVGDRYVLEEMRKSGFLLGGEQSGHVIFLRHTTTGDGQLTALKLLTVMSETGKSLADLISGIPQYPQVLVNVPVREDIKHKLAEHLSVREAVRQAEETLGTDGRVLVRPSGTEALVRVMVEGKDGGEIANLAGQIIAVIKNL